MTRYVLHISSPAPLNILSSPAQKSLSARPALPSAAYRSPLDLTGRVYAISSLPCNVGGYGVVYKGTLKRSPADAQLPVAVKAPYLVNLIHDEDEAIKNKRLKLFRRELKLWKGLDHDNILPLLGVLKNFEGPHSGLVSPWAKHGTLTRYLTTHATELSLPRRFRIISDVIAGLSYLHQLGIIHGDLSGSNLLVDDKQTVKLTDFGLSDIKLEFEGTSYFTSASHGAIRWTAPELLRMDDSIIKTTTQSDIYSFGSVVYQILSGRYPYTDIQSTFLVASMIHNGIKPPRPIHPKIEITDAHWAFINDCWSPAQHRPDVLAASHIIRNFHLQSLDKTLCILIQPPDLLDASGALHASITVAHIYKDIAAIASSHGNHMISGSFQNLSAGLSYMYEAQIQSILSSTFNNACNSLRKLVGDFVLWTKREMTKALVSDAYVCWTEDFCIIVAVLEALHIEMRTPNYDGLREALEGCFAQDSEAVNTTFNSSFVDNVFLALSLQLLWLKARLSAYQARFPGRSCQICQEFWHKMLQCIQSTDLARQTITRNNKTMF